MAKGLRIHHPTERNVILLVPIPAKSINGTPKDMHIHLDENGDSIVSEGVWGELNRAGRSGLWVNDFIVLNEVLDPPTIIAGFDSSHTPMKPAKQVHRDGVSDAKLQAIAQQFAPNGVKVRITPKESGK